MTSRISKLVLAAVLTGSIPAAASAHDDCDHARDERAGVVYPGYPAPASAPVVAPKPLFVRDGWRERELREQRWRELSSVRAELQGLDAARAEYHARNAWRPGQLRRYDRWYFERRAELVARMERLERVAWR